MSIEEEKQKLCLACLKCCERMIFPVTVQRGNTQFMETMIHFYKERGCKITDSPSNKTFMTHMSVFVSVPFPCPHLSPSGCNIYATRPKACRNYDGRKDPTMNGICKWYELPKET